MPDWMLGMGWGSWLVLIMIPFWILGILGIVLYVIYFIVEMSCGRKGKGQFRKKRRRH